jgi:methionyl-tRNA formyltransferase
VTAEHRRAARVAFVGSGSFGVPILEALASMPDVDLVAVVSVPDRPAGRSGRPSSPPAVVAARGHAIPVQQPERLRSEEMRAALAALDLDAVVLADYGRLVPGSLLGVTRHGFLNVHPSALPRHRGATPIQATILAGDSTAAVTLFEMDEGLDTGPIVATSSWALTGAETAPELEADAAARGATLLRETLRPWLAGDRPAVPQPPIGATVTPTLRREEGRLDPTRGADELARAVRAYSPWPGSFVETAAGRLQVITAAAAAGEPADAAGILVADGDGVALATIVGRLRLLEVRPAGGRTMSGAELRRGRPQLIGAAVLEPAGAAGAAS